jgi:hypothetical protein
MNESWPDARLNLFEVLMRCFSTTEWEWLQEEPSFSRAVKLLKTLEDVERFSTIGDKLIRLAEAGLDPNNRKPAQAAPKSSQQIVRCPSTAVTKPGEQSLNAPNSIRSHQTSLFCCL